jgi:hypothetical protein
MPIILRHFWEFAVAVSRRWGALVTGGFIIGLIAVYEHARGRPIGGRLFWIAVIISLLIACFSVWRKERSTVERLSRGREVLDHLSRSLTAIDKFIRVIHDPNQEVPIDRINEWEVETRIYLREHVSEAAENLFMSETGTPPPPPYKFIEQRSEPLRRLHYRSYQLHKILERLGLD